MSIWEQFVRSLLTSGDTPKMFSLFHVVGFVIVVLLGVGLVFLSKYKIQNNPLAYKITVLVFWGIILIFEILKQITFSYSIKNNQLVVDYNWIGFPFQFCSTPLYILPLIGFFKT